MERGLRLRQFIEAEAETLYRILRAYVYRAGLSEREQDADAAASELLSEVVVEALRHEDRLRPGTQPRAWLLGIAVNLIKRKRTELVRRDQREPLARDLIDDDSLSDDELFDQVAALTVDDLEADADAQVLLVGLSAADRQVLSLAVLHGLDGEALAHELGVTPGAARVRLYRALNRLRDRFRLLKALEREEERREN